MQFLLRWGANIDDADKVGNTAGHLAAMEGHAEAFRFLLLKGPGRERVLSARNDHGETPKMLAQQYHKVTVLGLISELESGDFVRKRFFWFSIFHSLRILFHEHRSRYSLMQNSRLS